MLAPRTQILLTLPALAVASLVLTTPGPAKSPTPIATPMPAPDIARYELPSHLNGSFQWDGDAHMQTAALDVEQFERSADGTALVATGRGTYEADAHFSFRIEVDTRTGRFTMTESDPSVANFITNGQHVGFVHDDGNTLVGRWSDEQGGSGTLELSAVERSMRPAEHPNSFANAQLFAGSGAEHIGDGVHLQILHSGPKTECAVSVQQPMAVHYKGWSRDGEFDDSWKRGAPVTFTASRVIPGFGAAMMSMCEGDYGRVFIPAAQAYGAEASAHRPSGDLMFEIEIVDVRDPRPFE